MGRGFRGRGGRQVQALGLGGAGRGRKRWEAPAPRGCLGIDGAREGAGQLTYRGVSALFRGALTRATRGRWPCRAVGCEAVAATAAAGTGSRGPLSSSSSRARACVPPSPGGSRPQSAGDACVPGSAALREFMRRWRLLAGALIAFCRRRASSVSRGEPPGSPCCLWWRR